jgi:threonine/homoserine/homoserine lactone efflux protein
MPDYIPFISYVIITTFTPGPNNITSMINSGRVGLRKGIKFNFGIFVGFTVVMLLCGLFGALLSEYLPAVKPYLVYVGAAYILWLAYKIFKSEYRENDDGCNDMYGFKEGISLQFVNVKVILFGVTTLSTFIVPYYNQGEILLFAIFLAILAFISTVSWALFGSVFHKLFIKKARIMNTLMAALLVYTAITIVI